MFVGEIYHLAFVNATGACLSLFQKTGRMLPDVFQMSGTSPFIGLRRSANRDGPLSLTRNSARSLFRSIPY